MIPTKKRPSAKYKAKKSPGRPTLLALGYCRVSTQEQATDGASLAAQENALKAYAVSRGWDIEIVTDAGFSGSSLDRPAMTAALARLEANRADVLVSVRLDRFTRSNRDLLDLMDASDHEGWTLATVDGALNTSTTQGRANGQDGVRLR